MTRRSGQWLFAAPLLRIVSAARVATNAFEVHRDGMIAGTHRWPLAARDQFVRDTDREVADRRIGQHAQLSVAPIRFFLRRADALERREELLGGVVSTMHGGG